MHAQTTFAFWKYNLEISIGFRKGYNAQQCLIWMIEKLQDTLDKCGIKAALLTDLSKTII